MDCNMIMHGQNLVRLKELIITIIIITFLHEIGHVLSFLVLDQIATIEIVKPNPELGLLLPYTIAVTGITINLFSALAIPVLFQFIYIKKERKSYLWLLFILWGHRWDFIIWLEWGNLLW